MDTKNRPAAHEPRNMSYLAVLRVCAALCCVACLASCSIVASSPKLAREAAIPLLKAQDVLLTGESGNIPYQRLRLPGWSDELRYVWVVGPHDFRKSDQVELVLYFHGMHAKDYYRAFSKELEELAAKRNSKPFLFVGFVDAPYTAPEERSVNRWADLAPKKGGKPEKLFETVNAIYGGFTRTFPHLKKSKTKIVLAGFSGGGRVLDSVGNWLASAPADDPYAEVFRSRLSKMVYFDCWFDSNILTTVPALLETNPRMKIVSTVYMDKPSRHADLLADKLQMRTKRKKDELVGMGGRLLIYRDKSHWEAMISRLLQALEV
jgi:hypothetical protein